MVHDFKIPIGKRDYQADLAICEAATPGPWEVKTAETHASHLVVDIGGCKARLPVYWVRNKEKSNALNDGKFIAFARTALPYYIQRCMALEGRITELEGQVGMLREVLEELFDTAKGINYRFTMDCMGPSLTEKVEKALSQTAQAGNWKLIREDLQKIDTELKESGGEVPPYTEEELEIDRILRNEAKKLRHNDAMRRVVEAAKEVAKDWDIWLLREWPRHEGAQKRVRLLEALAALERSENHESNG